MVKTIYLLLVLSLISFSCTTTGTTTGTTTSSTKGSLVAQSKYPQYTISQAKLLVDTGKCKIVTGTLNESDFRLAMVDDMARARGYEPVNNNLRELFSAIDSYIELDNANAFVLYEGFSKYAFTTMSCSE